MSKKMMLCAGLMLLNGVASAQFVERPEPLGLDSAYVPVNLNALANYRSTLDAPSAQVSLQNIPLQLAQNGEKNNLFLEKAGWPDWAKDPTSFYAEYDNTPKTPTDALPVVHIPTDDYSAVYVLASCEAGAEYSNVLGLRIGVKRGSAQTTYRDYEFELPRAGEKTAARQNGSVQQDGTAQKNGVALKEGVQVVKALAGANGAVYLLRLPLNGAFSQEFGNHRQLDVEITKKLRLSVAKPDAARFQYRPLGLPSGIHLYGMTFERAPLRFSMRSTQVSHIFNQPQVPSFELHLQPVENHRLKNLTVRAKATDYYGNVIEFPAEEVSIGPLAAFSEFQRTLSLPVTRRGYYVLDVTVESAGRVLLQKQTTFALLPADTRRHRATSPFGTWDFGGTHHTPSDSAVVGPLYVKAGLRYGMFPFSKAERDRYGVLKGNDPKVNARTDLSKLDEEIAKIKASGEVPERWLLFHEDAISGDHVTRTPDFLTGKNYKLSAEEQKKFDLMTNIILESVPKIRRAFPGIKFYLGNGVPHLMEEFLRHKLPAETFDVLGNEAAGFQRLPESQPTDFVANNPSMWMEHELLKHYGYEGKGVEQSYEIMYPSSNPGNLTLRQQANYVVRNVMHSLAWRVPAIRFEGIADPGNSYYHSNWGGTGLMFARPNLSPKPLYVATATMTQMLDGATFSRIIPTGTTTVYAFEFKKPAGGFITCLWTPSAAQQVRLKTAQLRTAQSRVVVTDLMCNQKFLALDNGEATLIAESDPVFVESSKPLKIEVGAPVESALPAQEYSVISTLEDAAQWQVVEDEDDELEAYNFMQPRRKGRFAVQTVANFDGRQNVLQIKPLPENQNQENNARWWIPQYTQLQFKTPLEVPGKPTHIGLMVNGNGGWGRIIFELEDATGQRWISLGTEQDGAPNPWLADWMSKDEFSNLKGAGVSDWNSNDVWGHSMINFNGWRYLQFPLPGNYPGEGYHWPYTSQWRCVRADGSPGDYIVHYPLKATKLVVTARSKVLYGTEVLPVRRPEIYLRDLSVSYGDPETAFWKPDLGQR